ncbi:MAG TPA: D-2-hydroxyacid dehydrogenase [Thermoanaerobaculia bacterium]|nr:D-2-hydroxyacid dehydrogenase [Thermoanaerobaculia bacterium]
MTTTVLIPEHFESDLAPRSGELGVNFIPYDPEGRPLRDPSGAAALFRWWIPRAQGDRLIETIPTLWWIHTGSAGVDHILTPAFLASNIQLTNSAGVHAVSISEWVVAAMLSITKDLPRMREQQRSRIWEKVERPELGRQQVVILGAGEIAGHISRRLRAFDVTVTAVRRRASPDARFDAVALVSDLPALLKSADWLIIAVPLTAETRGLVNRSMMEQIPSTGRVVNVARGEIVDEGALVDLLREGRLAGAVLDVFQEEPLPSAHPFWTLDGVTLLPHTTWRSPRVKERQLDLFLRNLRHFVASESLENLVDVRAGY